MKRGRSGQRNWTFLLFMLFGFVLTLNGFGSGLFNNDPAPDPVAKAPQAAKVQTAKSTTQAYQAQAPKIPAKSQGAVKPNTKKSADLKSKTRQPGAAIAATPQPTPTIVPAPPPAPAPIPAPVPNPAPQRVAIANTANTKYGHFPYREAPSGSLSKVQGVWMHRETARAFKQMAADARREGAYLVPVSGFRGVSLQSELFENQIARKGSIERAALVSAPPGHSEHHTGYAIDMGDADNPGTHVEMSFEQTPSFRWLNRNAPRYGFELSFPPANTQGISYEPWHWRFVGSQASANVFAVARSR